MALLLNMTRRLRFAIAQPVTIVGWYVSSLCLVALTATASGPLVVEPANEYIWSQAFYYGIYSSILYFLVASFMTVTYMGARAGHYPKDFMLTPSQRTLMLQTIMLLLYLLLGALLFGKLEGWTYLDAVYWSVVTLFTIGFGDNYPMTTVGRALLFPYALVGIISLGLVIGSIRSLVVDRGKRRLDARILEKKRREMLRSITLKGKDDILVPVKSSASTLGSVSGLTEFERREREFKLMRKIQEHAARRRRWIALAVSAGSWFVLWGVGAKIFQECEDEYQGWTYFDAFYFAFVSLTTIGYGDVTPVSNAGKSFFVFWALLALPTTTVLISNAGDTVVRGIREATDQIATVTILPGERGFRKDLKQLLRTLSCGFLFHEEIEQTPPGFIGQTEKDIDDAAGQENDVEGSAKRDQADLQAERGGASEANKKADDEEGEETHFKRVEANKAEQQAGQLDKKVSFQNPPSTPHHQHHLVRAGTDGGPHPQYPVSIPAHKPDYHLTLIEEIGRVMRHLKHHPPRKYTFHEWAWYLKLIGEDEADAERHRQANPHVKRKKLLEQGKRTGVMEGQAGKGEGEDPAPWSWVGTRSPLMGSQEEAEWILERLIARLEEELREVKEERRKESTSKKDE
jgi:potassium channel subfamily K